MSIPIWAENDERGAAWCNLCPWTLPPGSITSDELAEHRIAGHLRAAHGQTVVVRRRDGVGAPVVVP